MDHDAYITEALGLARRGGAWVSPNPRVGAIVVREGRIVGRGWHKQFGGPHAEVCALQEAGAAARGATLYCTLEPCNHTGKTPPCVNAILAAGIRTVVFGVRDPNPVAGGGESALRAAGISTVANVRETDCRKLNAPFFKVVGTGLPWVSLKWAMSADGKIAAAGGDSKWITSEPARALGQRMRAQHDAVLIGSGTLLADGSRLNCRASADGMELTEVRQPRRIILDSSARTPLSAPLWGAAGGAVTVVTSPAADPARVEALRARGAQILLAPQDTSGRLDLTVVLRTLAAERVLSVLVEGGSGVLGSFIDERLADRACVFIAPTIIGGRDSLTAVGGRGALRMSEALPLSTPRVTSIGPDVLLSGALSAWDWDDTLEFFPAKP